MNKRVSASNIMRVVSILGIICLLALQWVWWRNAYRAVEMDVMSRAQICLIKGIDKAIMYQLDSTSKGIPIVNELAGEKRPKIKKTFATHALSSAFDIGYTMEECINLNHKPLTDSIINARYRILLKQELGFVPKYELSIFRDSVQIKKEDAARYSRYTLGGEHDTIVQQFGYKAYTLVVFASPVEFYIRKGAMIFGISIVLVLLISSILILLYRNMRRDRKFADFIIDYTRMMTHDLRTPVTGLQMIFKMFQKNQFSDPGMKEKYIMEGIYQTNKILLNLDNILYMAKSEQREFCTNREDIDINDFIERTLKSYRERDYNPKTVAIETIYEPESFHCRMDANLMENVVCNLMENSIKFTGVDAKITVSCSLVKDVVELRFRDNGKGMAEADQKRIFEIFERGSSNNDKQFPGFGIGLHFVQRVVNAHGGKITVKSEVGRGTEFIIRFFS